MRVLPELLSPAGSFEGMKAVIAAGADAVYIGGARFGARAYAENPDEDLLLSAVDYAHLHGVRIYLTVNTLLKEEELGELVPFLKPYYLRGIDGVLVQDFGVLSLLHRHFPDLPLHASTQMTVTGPFSAKMLRSLNVTRIVPARELSLPELKTIHEESGLEVEAFVHGALCFCYSGQCLLSSLLGGRSGNRGRCAQPCRLPYSIGGKDGTFLSPKDLCAIDLLPQLAEAGVISLKIEGRMKTPEYAAGVTSVYRRYLDLYEKDPAHYRVKAEDRQLLAGLFSREGFTDGYFTRHNGPEMMAMDMIGEEAKLSRGRQDVLSEMRARFVEPENMIPIRGKCVLRTGLPLAVSVSCGGFTGYAEGPVTEAARKMPLTEERIEEQMRKTGGSGFEFESLETDSDGNSFVPVSILNGVRRDALENLKENMLAGFRRTEPEIAETQLKKSSSGPVQSGSPAASSVQFLLSAACITEGQYRALLQERDISRIYYPAELLPDGAIRKEDPVSVLKEKIRECSGAGKEFYLALPYIERNGACRAVYEAAGQLAEDGLHFLARSPESWAHLKELGLCGFTALDEGIYTWNSEAVRFFRSSGILFDTAPYELNRKELFRRDNTGSEIAVYGRIPLMVSAQCFRKNTQGCLRENGENSRKGSDASAFLKMTDRKGTDFLINNVCVFCYNVLYNSVPTNLLDEAGTVRREGFRSARLAFTDEDREECRRICRAFAGSYLRWADAKPEGLHTKGHFTRGVL